MKDLVEFIAKSLVKHPDQVRVTEIEGDRATVYEVHVAPDDMGKVIGKQGRVAKAIRTTVRAAAAKQGRTVHVEIMD